MAISRNEISLSKLNSIIDKFYAYTMAEIIKAILSKQSWAEVVFENRLKEITMNPEIMSNPQLNPLVYTRRQADLETYSSTLINLNSRLVKKEDLTIQELFVLSTVWVKDLNQQLITVVDTNLLQKELAERVEMAENSSSSKLLISLGHYFSYQFSQEQENQELLNSAIEYYAKASNLGNHRARTYLASHYGCSKDFNHNRWAGVTQYAAALDDEANALIPAGKIALEQAKKERNEFTGFYIDERTKQSRIDSAADVFFKALNQGIIFSALEGIAQAYMIANQVEIAAQIIALCMRHGNVISTDLSDFLSEYQYAFYESSYKPMVSMSFTSPHSYLDTNRNWFTRNAISHIEHLNEDRGDSAFVSLINEHPWGEYIFKIGSMDLTYNQMEPDTIYFYSVLSSNSESKDSATETLHCLLKKSPDSIVHTIIEPDMMMYPHCVANFLRAIQHNSTENLTFAKEQLSDYLSRINVIPRDRVFPLFLTSKLAHEIHNDKLAKIARIEFDLESGNVINEAGEKSQLNNAKSMSEQFSSYSFNISPLERKKIDALKIRFKEERNKKYSSTLFSSEPKKEASEPSPEENNNKNKPSSS